MIVECRCYAALMDKVQMWGRQLKGSKEYFLLLTATYSEAFITMSIDWDLNSVREHWTGIPHTYLIRKQFSMEYVNVQTELRSRAHTYTHTQTHPSKYLLRLFITKLVPTHPGSPPTNTLFLRHYSLFTHTQLTLQNHWKNHRGSQSSNGECQIKVGSILNILTNINEEHPEKMNQL